MNTRLSCLLALILFACGSSGSGTGDGGSAGGDASSHDAGEAEECASQILCGQPSACCEVGDECFEGQCVADCSSGVRCGAAGEVCCPSGDVCLSGSCAVPGASCGDSFDCQQPGEFCEPTLGACLPQPDPLTCEVRPAFAAISVFVEASYEAEDILSIPVVADLDGDGDNEVVVNLTNQDGGSYQSGLIAILDGNDVANVILTIPHNPLNNQYGSHGRSTIAVGDVNGDSLPDIIYATRPTGAGDRVLIAAVDSSGTLLWTSKDAAGSPYGIRIDNGAITLANLDADAAAEVIIGGAILDNDGLVVADPGGAGQGGYLGSNNGYNGGITAVADLDGDTIPEIISGRNAWKLSWNVGPPVTATLTPYWTSTGPDGYPAVADFDLDGQPEVVIVGDRTVRVVEGQTGLLFCGAGPAASACASPAARTQAVTIPGGATNNRGGPPTIADFDGDGRPEIGVAGGHSYSVYDLNRPGEEIAASVSPVPAAGALFARWSAVTQDQSSNATGSSVFDFQGDGLAEVVYADECYMRVYSGSDGTVQLEIENSSATIHEYPLIVDLDRDGNSELLIVANDSSNCEGQVSRKGLFVYGDANDLWVPTRKIWTQHAYHVSNADSAGNVPLVESNNWEQPGLNNYRQNVQGNGVFNGPDLTLSLSASTSACGTGQLILRARVENQGDIGVPAGVLVNFYQGVDNSSAVLASAMTTVPLLPGGSELLEVMVPAPGQASDYIAIADEGVEAGAVIECDELNNQAQTSVGCPTID